MRWSLRVLPAIENLIASTCCSLPCTRHKHLLQLGYLTVRQLHAIVLLIIYLHDIIRSNVESFTSGTMKGSLKESVAAIVRMGSTHEKMAAISSMRPVRGSMGNRARWNPRGVKFSSWSNALMACRSCHREQSSVSSCVCVNSSCNGEQSSVSSCVCVSRSYQTSVVMHASITI